MPDFPNTSTLHPLFAAAIDGFVAHGRAYARALQAERATQTAYRCPECGAATRRDRSDNPPETVACWSDDRGVICTGRAVLENPTAEACADVRAWQREKAGA